MTAWEQIVDVATHEFQCLGDLPTMTRVTLRLAMAAIVGGLLGYERESKGKAAGLRTHMLVSLGAAVFVLAPLVDGASQDASSRVIQGLVAGIGFLGAGAIVKGKEGLPAQGLTTAASIWIAAAMGMAVGLGRAGVAIIGVLLALAILQLIPTDIHPPRNGAPPSGAPPS